jgi:hypothetical protein
MILPAVGETREIRPGKMLGGADRLRAATGPAGSTRRCWNLVAHGRGGQQQWRDLPGQLVSTDVDRAPLTLGPGTYQFRIIDSTDAASMFPSLTQLEKYKGTGLW